MGSIIEAFTQNMLDGTTIVPHGGSFVLREHELDVQYMALESRFRRRMHGEAIHGAIERGKEVPRSARAIIPGPTDSNRDTAFLFLTLAYPEHIPLKGGYEQYRQGRANMLYAYAMGFLNKYRFLKRVIGIATEPPPEATGRKGSSEDMVMVEPLDWTPELEAEAIRLCNTFKIMQEGQYQETAIHRDEYPTNQ